MNGSFVVSETACDLYLHTYNLQQKRNMTHLDKNSPFGFEATSYIFTIIKHWFMEANNLIYVDCGDKTHKLWGKSRDAFNVQFKK